MVLKSKWIPVTGLLTLVSANAVEFTPLKFSGPEPLEQVVRGSRLSLEPRRGKAVEDALLNQPGMNLHSVGASQDINLLGLSQDNVAVTVGGCRIFGACPGRMDPPLSHVPVEQINDLEIVSGPFDVSHFGTFGGILKFDKDSRDRVEGLHLMSEGDSFDSFSNSFEAVLRSDRDQLVIGGSQERLGMPETGGSKKLSSFAPVPYRDTDEDYYRAQSLHFDYRVDESDQTELRFGTRYENKDQSLFPGKMMDSTLERARFYEFGAKRYLSNGRTLDFSWFYNGVEHAMDNYTFRQVAAPMRRLAEVNASQQGFRLALEKTSSWELGVESYRRTWDMLMNSAMTTLDASMHLLGLWAQRSQSFGVWDWTYGFRLDDVSSRDEQPNSAMLRNRAYPGYQPEQEETLFGLFVEGRRAIDSKTDWTVGAGRSQRPVDPLEHWISRMGWVGNPGLKPPKIDEFRLGIEKNLQGTVASLTLFHRDLTDHIHPATRVLAGGMRLKTFENIDATIEGVQLAARHQLSSNWNLSGSAVVQQGEKSTFPSLNTDPDLAEVPPFVGRIELEYQKKDNTLRLFSEMAASHDDVDSMAGEVPLPGYAFFNFSFKREMDADTSLEFAVLNIFDKDAVRTNSYDRDPVNRVVRALPEQGRTFQLRLNRRF